MAAKNKSRIREDAHGCSHLPCTAASCYRVVSVRLSPERRRGRKRRLPPRTRPTAGPCSAPSPVRSTWHAQTEKPPRRKGFERRMRNTLRGGDVLSERSGNRARRRLVVVVVVVGGGGGRVTFSGRGVRWRGRKWRRRRPRRGRTAAGPRTWDGTHTKTHSSPRAP